MGHIQSLAFLTLLLILSLGLPPASAQTYQPPASSGDPQVSAFLGERRPWDLSVRAFVGYNDNVPLVEEQTFCRSPFTRCATKSFYSGFSINGNYRLVQTDEWLAGAGLSFDQTFHGKSIGPASSSTDPKDYNLTALSPSLFGRYFFGFGFGNWIMPASVGMTYTYRKDWLPILGPLVWHTDINTLQWDLGVDLIRQLKLGINYSLSFLDFNPKDSTNSRDATAHAVGISGTYSFQGGLRSITLGYQYGTSNARSRNFDVPNSNGVKAQFKTWVYGPLWAALDVGSTWEDYKGFNAVFITPPGRKWQRVEDYGATLLYVLTDQVTVDLFYKYTGWASNQRLFEAHRNNGGMGVTYRF